MLARIAQGPLAALEGSAAGVRQIALDSAKIATLDESVPGGKCTRWGVGVEGEGSGLEVRVFDAGSGEELDRAHGFSAAAVRACAPSGSPRAVKVELRATAGRLDAVVGARVR